MPRYRSIPRRPAVADLRQAPGNDADVTVSAASETTNDEPEHTEAAIAPEASPAATKSSGAKAPKKAKAKS